MPKCFLKFKLFLQEEPLKIKAPILLRVFNLLFRTKF